MADNLARAFRILEFLVTRPEGASLSEIARTLGIPNSATHRMLGELLEAGYVRHGAVGTAYVLTTQLVAVAFEHLARGGIVGVAQPILDRLAAETSELVRLALVDGERLRWVAKAQGTRAGLRYDPEMGREPTLSSMATGFAWLAGFPDDMVARLIRQQGFGDPATKGPKAPRTLEEVLVRVREAREAGYGLAIDCSALGISTIAIPVRPHPLEPVVAVMNITGPTSRLPEARLPALAALLKDAAAELADALGKASTVTAR